MEYELNCYKQAIINLGVQEQVLNQILIIKAIRNLGLAEEVNKEMERLAKLDNV
jgi:hypothetical protein